MANKHYIGDGVYVEEDDKIGNCILLSTGKDTYLIKLDEDAINNLVEYIYRNELSPFLINKFISLLQMIIM